MLFYVDADPLHVDRYVQGKKRVPSSSFGGKKGETKLNGVCCGELVRAFNIVMYILTLRRIHSSHFPNLGNADLADAFVVI